MEASRRPGTGVTTPLRTGRDQTAGQGWKGGGGVLRNGVGRKEPRRAKPRELIGTLATSRLTKGGR